MLSKYGKDRQTVTRISCLDLLNPANFAGNPTLIGGFFPQGKHFLPCKAMPLSLSFARVANALQAKHVHQKSFKRGKETDELDVLEDPIPACLCCDI